MKAILLAVSGFFLFTAMDISIKWLLQSDSLVQVTFFNCFFALIGLLIWIYPNFNSLKTAHPKIHFIRAALIVVADLLAFYSYGQVPLAEAYSLLLTAPLFMVFFAVLMGYEKFSITRMIVSLLGFIGILLVLKPGYEVLDIALLAALGAAIIGTCSVLMVTHYKANETPQAFAFYGLCLLTIVSGIATLFNFTSMPMTDVIYSIGGGMCYAAASALVVTAFHLGRPSAISSLQYTQLVWGLVLGYLIWNELPDVLALIGGLIIILVGLCLIRLKAE